MGTKNLREAIMTTAMVLCGGKGTRLQGIVDGPKALVEFGGRPFLEHLIDWLKEVGVDRVLLLTGHGDKAIRNWMAGYNALGKVQLSMVKEEKPLGTGGAIKAALKYVDGDEPFVVLNGDSFFDGIELPKMVEFHKGLKERGTRATLALAFKSHDVSRYGLVHVDHAVSGGWRRVTEFLEKNPHARNGHVSVGLYVLTKGAFVMAPKRKAAFSIERDLFPELARCGYLSGYAPAGSTHLDFGTPDGLEAARKRFEPKQCGSGEQHWTVTKDSGPEKPKPAQIGGEFEKWLTHRIRTSLDVAVWKLTDALRSEGVPPELVAEVRQRVLQKMAESANG